MRILAYTVRQNGALRKLSCSPAAFRLRINMSMQYSQYLRRRLFEEADDNALRVHAAKFRSAEAFADSLAPAMKEPKGVFVGAQDGRPVATSSQDLTGKYPEVEYRAPDSKLLSAFEKNVEERNKHITFYREMARQGLIGFRDDVQALPPVIAAVAQQIKAEYWRKVEHGRLPYATGLGGSGIELRSPFSRVFIDAAEDGKTVSVRQIAIEKPGAGLGTAIMTAIHAYAAQVGKAISVEKGRPVDNAPVGGLHMGNAPTSSPAVPAQRVRPAGAA